MERSESGLSGWMDGELPIAARRFGYQDILALEPGMTYEQLGQVIAQLCEAGRIVPIKKSGKTSFIPSVYREYKKVSPKTDYSSFLPEISALHPRLAISKYMGKPEAYAENREAVTLLSEWFWKQEGNTIREMSVKERSYDIWGDEKFLESGKGRAILGFCGLEEEALNCYHAPEPFFCFRTGKKGMVLVLENKDSWYSLGKALRQTGTGTVCGQPVSLLVYGEGNKASRDQALTLFLRDESSWKDMEICYTGDIDRAGIGILYGVKKHNPEISVAPFLPFYQFMIQRAMERIGAGYKMMKTEDDRDLVWNRSFLDCFSGKEREVVMQVLDEGCRIPQEILAYPDYERMCGWPRRFG